MATLRVRTILSSLDADGRKELKKLLPPKLSVPDVKTASAPSMLVKHLPETEAYAFLGIIAENLLRLPHAEITLEKLILETRRFVPTFSSESETKVRTSKTTQPFLDCLVATRKALEAVLRSGVEEGPLKYEEGVQNGAVEGHPDIYNNTQVFEVKLTGMLTTNWTSFLFQVFAYGALMPSVKDLYLVLPLQQMVWHCDIRTWDKRQAYLTYLNGKSTTNQTTGVESMLQASLLCNTFCIGHHAKKEKTLLATVQALEDTDKPYQIFLGGPQTSRMNLKQNDIEAAKQEISDRLLSVFVHSQYIINLSKNMKEKEDEEDNDWHIKLLQKSLKHTRDMGGKGVVVHVGKSTKQPIPEAIEQMRSAILQILPFATPDCPLLLETPAGQGTELLRGREEFLNFVESFQNPALRVCIDTCHVFACGHDPLEYIQTALTRPNLVKLVHYNDSADICGSCVDRHALVGTGHIGFEKMAAIAELCRQKDIPMVIE
jgi:deoxyribonuclease-4